MGEISIGYKSCAKHLNERIVKHFSGSRSTANEPNFKILCNCIHELGSVQHKHTLEIALPAVVLCEVKACIYNPFYCIMHF